MCTLALLRLGWSTAPLGLWMLCSIKHLHVAYDFGKQVAMPQLLAGVRLGVVNFDRFAASEPMPEGIGSFLVAYVDETRHQLPM